MREVQVQDVARRIEQALTANDIRTAEQFLWPAMDQYPGLSVWYYYAGTLAFNKQQHRAAVMFYEKGLDLEPNPAIMSNLGAAYRRMGMTQDALSVLQRAASYDPDNGNVWTNLAAAYVNEGEPHTGLKYGKKALRCPERAGFDKDRARWNAGLLHLEMGDWKQGFRMYRAAHGVERPIRIYHDHEKIPEAEPELLSPKLHSENARKGKTVVVWGEQGLGDELMFGSMLHRLKADYDVIFECHPRLEWLHKKRHPDIRIFPTRKDDYRSWPIEIDRRPQFKLPIGDLGSLYIKSGADFQRNWDEFGPFYAPDLDEVDRYRKRLETLAGGRKIIGLTTRGGVPQTHRFYRLLPQPVMDGLLEMEDVMIVSLDYEDMSMLKHHIEEERGLKDKFVWFAALNHAWDYHHQAALMKATDAVVTVCQTAAHMSAAMAHKTMCIVPKQCAWRYAKVGDPAVWFWYPSPNVKLYRQSAEMDWTPAVTELLADVEAL